jgi:hypothetical protein
MKNVVFWAANASASLVNFATLKMEATRSSETSVNTRTTQRHIPEDDILHSHRCESLKSYRLLKCFSFCTTSIQKPSVSTRFAKQIMPILRILCYNGSLVT